jgi:amino acid permease
VEGKKAELDGVMFSQKRELELNESHRQRHRYYIYMLLILVVAIVAFVIIARMREMITFVPDFVYDLMVVLIFVIPGFLIYFAYLDIQRRDHMDFSKVQLAQPREESGEEKDERKATYVEEGDLSAIGKLCKGQDCCPDETKDQTGVTWESSAGKCMPYTP